MKFEFEAPDNRIYSAHWYFREHPFAKGTEVAIFRGCGYKTSFYTNKKPSEITSLNFIIKYLKSL